MIQLKVRYPQNILSRGFVELFRTGPWNGIGFSGRPNLKPDTIFRYEVVYTEEVVYYHYELLSSVVSRFALSHNGVVERWIWIDRTQEWCSGYKMPHLRNSWFDRNMTLRECKIVCLKNYSLYGLRKFRHKKRWKWLLTLVWRLYEEGKSLELIDEALWDSCYQIELL
ncbi:hypothetical protein ACSBR1_012161 [Camellia fascicularis]